MMDGDRPNFNNIKAVSFFILFMLLLLLCYVLYLKHQLINQFQIDHF